MIPVLLVGGIAMWLVWKGYRAFQRYETRKEARAPRATRDLLRREGEHLSYSDDSGDSNGGGSLQDQRKKKRVRFHDDDLHSDAWLTRQEKEDREAFIEHLRHLRRQRHQQARDERRDDKKTTNTPRHLHLSDSHNAVSYTHLTLPTNREV